VAWEWRNAAAGTALRLHGAGAGAGAGAGEGRRRRPWRLQNASLLAARRAILIPLFREGGTAAARASGLAPGGGGEWSPLSTASSEMNGIERDTTMRNFVTCVG
jgi:hypothetical protein